MSSQRFMFAIVLWCALSQTGARAASSPENGGRVSLTLPSVLRDATRATTVPISVVPSRNYDSAVLKVVSGGVFALEKGAGYQENITTETYFPALPANFQLRRDLGQLEKGKRFTEQIAVRSSGSGYGYITAVMFGVDKDGHHTRLGTVTSYGASDGRQLFTSDKGFLAAERLMINAGKGTSEAKEELIAHAIRGGASSSAKVTPVLFSPNPKGGLVTVSGRIQFTDRVGGEHPVRRVQVDLVEDNAGLEPVLASGATDEAGRYSLSFNLAAATSKDVFVVVKATGPTIRVVDPSGGNQWSMVSSIARVVRQGASVNLDVTATNLLENNTAFEVYEAINYASQYVATLSGQQPRKITVRFPEPQHGPDGSTTGNDKMHLAGTDAHDWDNIHHEYGHHIQEIFHLSNSPAGQHSGSNNLCKTGGHNKDEGIRLAWGEGWPTFFGVLLQRELGLAKLGIPNVGDTKYSDTTPAGLLSYDLEGTPVKDDAGEGNERAVMRALWSLYKGSTTASTDASISAADLWASVVKSRPAHFSHWWQQFVTGKSYREIASVGTALARQGLASLPQTPENNATLSSDADVEFKWSAVNKCADQGNGKYSLRIYSKDLDKPLFASAYSSATSLVLAGKQLKSLAGENGLLFWAVVAMDDTEPATGEYHGPVASLTIRPD